MARQVRIQYPGAKVELVVRDACGAALSGELPVSLSANIGRLTTPEYREDGIYVATFTSDLYECPGNAEITATVDGITLPVPLAITVALSVRTNASWKGGDVASGSVPSSV